MKVTSGHEMKGVTEFGPRTCTDLGSFLRNEAKAGHETDSKERLDKNGFSRQVREYTVTETNLTFCHDLLC